mmetsp:Transcript_102503/g.260351  ORF Transcript_102503/g.260351 Transcript_102503/m.260351 type:complete len:364 (+) Transcript_102503:89-1180(+)
MARKADEKASPEPSSEDLEDEDENDEEAGGAGDEAEAEHLLRKSKPKPLLSSVPGAECDSSWVMARSLGMFLGMVALGVAGMMYLERLRFTTALYVVTQIVTTIGYGDFTVTSDSAQFFCSFYVLAILILAAYAMNPWMEALQKRNYEAMNKSWKSVEGVSGIQSYKRCNKLVVSTFYMLMFVLLGTVFYATYEDCHCSYGRSAVPDCNSESYNLCMKSGGYNKNWKTAFYMSVITLTTVGFGDHSPRSLMGRVIAVPWMLFGVAAMANWVNEVRSSFSDVRQAKKERIIFGHKSDHKGMFESMSISEGSRLTKAEFRCYCLMRAGLLNKTLLKEIDQHFDNLDSKDRAADGVHFDDCFPKEA